MNAEQKRAWFLVILFVLACLGFAVIAAVAGFEVAWSALAVFGLGGLAGLIGRGERQDERDRAIVRRATRAGAMASYAAFVLGCMGVWFVQFAWLGRPVVSVHALAVITVCGAVVLFTARSLAVLVLYGRSVESEHA